MHQFGKGLGKAIGQRLDENCRIIIIGAFKTLGNSCLANAGRHDKAADIIRLAAFDRRDEI